MRTSPPPSSPARVGGDFRLLLQDELVARCQRNPRYSLRSFAQSLGIGSSDLSKLLHRKRAVTDAMVLRLGQRLGLDPEVIEAFRRDLAAGRKAPRAAGASDARMTSFRELPLDAFHAVADWWHFAILELLKVRGFVADPRWVARRLGLTVSEVNVALQRLERLGYLERTDDGGWRDKLGPTTSVSDEYSDAAKRRQQRQILEKARTALDEVPLAERDQSAIVMAVNSQNLIAAKALIKDFRRSLCALMLQGDERDQVYYLSVSLFPILHPAPRSLAHADLETTHADSASRP
jgi:uncharacterized protein (TIGR02147 family)